MSAAKEWMMEISQAIESAEEAIIEAADRLRTIGDLVYGVDGDEPLTRLSYDEIDCLAKARKWFEAEFATVQSARERNVS